MDKSYYFDPSSLDREDENREDVSEEITLDDWKPRKKGNKLIKSDWRRKQNGNDHNLQPSFDDVKKIKVYLQKRYPDIEIMEAFAISGDTLVAIKKDKYCPVEGILFDDLELVFDEIKNIKSAIKKLQKETSYIATNFFNDPDELKKFKLACKRKSAFVCTKDEDSVINQDI